MLSVLAVHRPFVFRFVSPLCLRSTLRLTQRIDRLKKQIIKSLVWSVALYGSETWTLRKKEAERIHAFEVEKDGENKLERQDVERAYKLN